MRGWQLLICLGVGGVGKDSVACLHVCLRVEMRVSGDGESALCAAQ